MARPKGRAHRKRKRRVQKGGLVPLAAVIPALISGGKSLALSGAAYGAKKALGKIIKKVKKKKRRWNALQEIWIFLNRFYAKRIATDDWENSCMPIKIRSMPWANSQLTCWRITSPYHHTSWQNYESTKIIWGKFRNARIPWRYVVKCSWIKRVVAFGVVWMKRFVVAWDEKR